MNKLWVEIINEARFYDGTPHDLQKYVEHFESKYCISLKPNCTELESRKQSFVEDVRPFVEQYGKPMCNEFVLYWTEHSPNGKKLRFEKEKVFDIKLRLIRWSKNNKNGFSKKDNRSELEQLRQSAIEHLKS